MRWVESGTLAAGLVLAGFAIADTPSYGKVETFQPGKKYNCVPTADRKGWDCNESGKASEPPPEVLPRAQAPAAAASTPQAQVRPAEPPPRSSALPSYLTNAAARGAPPTAAPRTEPIAEQKTAPTTPEAGNAESAPAVSAAPAEHRPESMVPAPAPPPAGPKSAVRKSPPSALGTVPSPSDFLALPGDQYVIELAHADSAAELPEPAVPRGTVYKLRLHQNGGERWLLLWGAFDSVESARAARDEVSATGLAPGWPRRIAPLQAEARRTTE